MQPFDEELTARRMAREAQHAALDAIRHQWAQLFGVPGPYEVSDDDLNWFLRHMTREELSEAMVRSYDRFEDGTEDTHARYFCGICWNIVRQVQDGLTPEIKEHRRKYMRHYMAKHRAKRRNA